MYRVPNSPVSTGTSNVSSRRQSVNDEWTGAIPMEIDILEQAKKEREEVVRNLEDEIFKRNQNPNRASNGRRIDSLKTQLVNRQEIINVMLNQQSTDLAFRRHIFPATRGQSKQIVYGM